MLTVSFGRLQQAPPRATPRTDRLPECGAILPIAPPVRMSVGEMASGIHLFPRATSIAKSATLAMRFDTGEALSILDMNPN
jgi:hypothetical protein